MRIRVIAPVTTRECERRAFEQYTASARADTEITTVLLDRGPASVESQYDEALAVPDVLAKIVEAEREGAHAVISNCMADPGVEAGRELVSIPVLGPAEIAMHMAAMLGHKFSVITILDRLIPTFNNQAFRLGLSRQLASVRAVNIPVLELVDRDRVAAALLEQSFKAVRDDGAHLLILGCTGMTGLARSLEEGLQKEGIRDVPVIDPVILALKVAEALAEMGLSHSKRSYPAPPVGCAVGD
jgi:allantoin racemase